MGGCDATAYPFGDGVFGQRFAGTITEPAQTRNDLVLMSIPVQGRLLKYNIWMDYNSNVNTVGFFTVTAYNVMWKDGTSIVMRSHSSYNRNNAAYDAWVLYTKGR